MSLNRKFALGGTTLPSSVVTPTTANSGDPVIIGKIPGVAALDADTDGKTTVFTDGIFDLSVKGVDENGNSAVAKGDILYFTDGDTPKVNKKTTGTRFGYAWEAVGSGLTDTVQVKVGY